MYRFGELLYLRIWGLSTGKVTLTVIGLLLFAVAVIVSALVYRAQAGVAVLQINKACLKGRTTAVWRAIAYRSFGSALSLHKALGKGLFRLDQMYDRLAMPFSRLETPFVTAKRRFFVFWARFGGLPWLALLSGVSREGA